jgi:hypothetical protein
MRVRIVHLLGAAAFWIGLQSASVANISEQTNCYDVKVGARPVAQIPSVIPTDPDTIVMRWPWFLDLKVTRVIEGQASRELTNVLSVQHGGLLPRTRVWWLRKNSAGTFNALYPEHGEQLLRCAADTVPAEPYLRPAAGRTLQDYRREGEREYGSYLDVDAN